MYIKIVNANIKYIVLYAVVIIFSLLIFPIFITVKANLSKEKNKLFFAFNLFGLRVFRGYAELISEGIIIHLTKTKAVIIPFDKIFEVRKSVEPLKDYHFIKLTTKVDLGNETSVIEPLFFSLLIDYFYNIIGWFVKNKKPYVKLSNNFNVYEGEDKLEIYLSITIVLNILMVLLSLIKILVGKLVYGK